VTSVRCAGYIGKPREGHPELHGGWDTGVYRGYGVHVAGGNTGES
jgi:hypothetical protein